MNGDHPGSFALQRLSPNEVAARVARVHAAYGAEWDAWVAVSADARVEAFGRMLRRWQATRPYPMRRCRAEALHDAPYLDDLYREALEALAALGRFDVVAARRVTSRHRAALESLWTIFEGLPVTGRASCVGITKAVMFLTNGRIGPGLDSHVRRNAAIPRPSSPSEWVETVAAVTADVAAFEARWGVAFRDVVPPHCRHVGGGRLYDMVFC